jgi:biotin transport system ATP-binding protein
MTNESLPTGSTAPIIDVHDLIHTFSDGTCALKGVTLRIYPGEFVLIAGKNGSGKTVFTRHLNALYRPTGGQVLVGGAAAHSASRETRRKVGLIFQDADSQIVGQTVKEDIAFGPQNLHLSTEEVEHRVRQALSLSGLEHLADHRPHRLSGGEKRRLAIAGVLAMDPQVIVLDEPFSNLDYPGVVSILRHILDLHRRGHTIIIVTHEIEKTCAHADRLVIFQNGTVALNGPPRKVLPMASDYGIRVPPGDELRPERLTWLS